MNKIIITRDTMISGTPVFVGDVVTVDDATAKILERRSEPYAEQNEKHVKLVAARAAAKKAKA